ncbi:MAG: DUF1003 domain-containing protein [Bacteroidota bacterium]|nr:DUF1003 domain-containing protein [Bacteroidota bacterium]
MKNPTPHEPLSFAELQKKYKPIENLIVKHKEKISPINKLALWITTNVGSMGFFFIIFCWTASWLSWNTLAPEQFRFDPFPAFVLWLFISNMIQIFLMPLIMVGQNIQSKHSELRAEQDFAINKKAEIEIETILKHLENQNELIIKILSKLEK